MSNTVDHIANGVEVPAKTGWSHQAERAVMPIAVVGLGGRFPGDATNPKALWEMVCQGKSAWSEFPKDRMSSEAYLHPNASKSGTFNSRGAHFLKEDVGLFDAPFFKISPNEAKAMDPQQRISLETTYEALENAGQSLQSISGHSIGVFVGASQIDYDDLLKKDVDTIPMYTSTGTSGNMLSNRISYCFDFKGPSITMDTACSSGLAALHVACQSLRVGESKQAIVGGAHIMLSPDTMVGMSMLKLFGEEGRSYTYDSRATGYGRGEGCVSVVLKPLADAERDGDVVRAVIRNTGANQDGKTSGITFPSCDAQTLLMKSVYESAGIDPLETVYVEAHGTGTAAGDPVEAEAIARVLGAKRESDHPLYVGSVKSNIGHLEAASGLAAMVKVIWALEEGIIPPNINFETPNKNIPMQEWKLKAGCGKINWSKTRAKLEQVPTAITPWPNSRIRQASISNFGFGGTNAHVILQQYQPSNKRQVLQNGNSKKVKGLANGHAMNGVNVKLGDTSQAPESPQRRLYVLSANDKPSLLSQMEALGKYISPRLANPPDEIMDRLAHTLSHRRSMLEWREAMSASTLKELHDLLSTKDYSLSRPSGKPTIGFVFTGQGAQWYAMGRQLLQYPVFLKSMEDSDRSLKKLGSQWSLLEELSRDAQSSLVNRSYLSQPATTAVQIALVSLFSSWGIKPATVVGHSSGEIAAAFAAGALSASACMKISYYRGVLAESLKEKRPERRGGMLAIGASPARVRPMIKRLGSAHVVLACINGPSLITASGDAEAISKLQLAVEDENLFNRRLKVDVAYHSPHMRDIAAEYLDSIKDVEVTSSGKAFFYSSVTGTQVNTASLGAQYWVDNMINPVQFVDAVQSIYEQKDAVPDVLLEIGPHSTLEAAIRDIMKVNPKWSSQVRYIASLSRGIDAKMTTLSMASRLFVLGCDIDLGAINNPAASSNAVPLNDLPSYPWNHSKRFWHESRLSSNHRLRKFPRSDLLGNLVDDYNPQEPRWRNVLRLTDLPWLADHQVQGSIILPMTGYLVMAIEAVFQYAVLRESPVSSSAKYKFREVRIPRSLPIAEDTEVEVSLALRPYKEGLQAVSKTWNEFSIFSWVSEGGWTEHCHGLVALQNENPLNPVNGERHFEAKVAKHQDTTRSLSSSCRKELDHADIYARFSRSGLEFGPMFRNVITAWASEDRSIGVVSVPNTVKSMPHEWESVLVIHPTTFDSLFQVTDSAKFNGDLSVSDLAVPVYIKEMTLSQSLPSKPGSQFMVYAQSKRNRSNDDNSDKITTFVVFDPVYPSEEPLIEVSGLATSRLPTEDANHDRNKERGLCYKIHWEPCFDLLHQAQFEHLFNLPDLGPATLQLQNLERAAWYLIQAAVQSIPEPNLTKLDSHLPKLYRVFKMLLERGRKRSLPFQRVEWLECGDVERTQFLSRFKSTDACGRLVCSIGENLEGIFKAQIDPLSIMLHDNLLERFYREHELYKRANYLCALIVDKLAHQNPSMKILEVGAGTGVTTMPILQALGNRFGLFDYTDISTGFFENVKEEQKEWAGKIQYRRFDVEQDPTDQGFEAESYDLVIGSNVFHATSNMERTMRNVRRLLKPGGKLLIVELTNQMLSFLTIFGTLPGWWLSEELERRDGPFMTETTWHTLLGKTGFSGLDGCIGVNGDGPPVSSIMLSTAVVPGKAEYPNPQLLLSPSSSLELVEHLSSELAALTGQSPRRSTLLESDLEDQYGIVLGMDDLFWYNLDENGLRKMQAMLSSARGILWVSLSSMTRNPTVNMVTGLARTVAAENAGLRFVTLDVESQNVSLTDTIMRVYKLAFGSNRSSLMPEREFAEMGGILYIPRVIGEGKNNEFVVRETTAPKPEPQPFQQAGRSLQLNIGTPGLLDSIYFADNKEIASDLHPSDIEIEVKATGINFKDVMIGLGQVPFDHNIGVECSGIVSAVGSDVLDVSVGDRVCAMTEGGYANQVRVNSLLATKISLATGFTESASMVIVFCTAYLAIFDVGRLSEGDSILIHAAAGGVGQAAIMLSQMVKAEVFVTIGSTEKKDFLMNRYGIPEDHIFSSRDTTFEQELMDITSQRGVDVVLNSTAGDILQRSWQCLAPFGRFLEIGQQDMVQESYISMGKFLDSVLFAGVDVGKLGRTKPLVFHNLLAKVVNLYESGAIQPVQPVTVFPISELQQALRLMQAGKHTGKFVIEAKGDSIALPAPSPKAITSGASASYLITGGTGGLGRSMTRWLAGQGAQTIILASRSGMAKKDIQNLVDDLHHQGTTVIVKRCDVGDRAQVEALVRDCRATLPPIRGVIHGAMALHDVLFEKMSFSEWCLNTRPRVHGAWNLHDCLASNTIDFFVMLASMSGYFGIPGQAAYAASNTFLDSFAAYRRSLGLPACTIDIGIVESVGYVAENKDRKVEISTAAHDSLKEAEFLALLKASIHQETRDTFRQTLTGCKLDLQKPLTRWAEDTKFAHVLHTAHLQTSLSSSSNKSSTDSVPIKKLLKSTTCPTTAAEIIFQGLIPKLSGLLMMPREDVDVRKPLVAFGLDSLVAVELRNWISRDLEANIPLMELMNNPSIEALAAKIAERSKLVEKADVAGK